MLRMVRKDDTTTGQYHTRQQPDCCPAVVEEAHPGHQSPGPPARRPWVRSWNHAVNRGLGLASSQLGSDRNLSCREEQQSEPWLISPTTMTTMDTRWSM